jgi:predicted nucleic acid-binding protein
LVPNRRGYVPYSKPRRALPEAMLATRDEVLSLIENRKLWGRGMGWIDAHLLASALISNCRLWTVDERFKDVCRDAGVKAVV